MLPAEYDLALYRGDTYRLQLQLWQDQAASQPYDLSSSTADSQIRNKAGGTTIVTMSCTVTAPNIIDAVLVATDSETLPKRRGAWDLQVSDAGGDIFSPIAGNVSVAEDITRLDAGRAARATGDVPPDVVSLWAGPNGSWSIIPPTSGAQGRATPPPAEKPQPRAGIDDAPRDGRAYVRIDGKWIPLSVALHGDEL